MGDLPEKFTQGLRHRVPRSPILLALIFLFKNEPSEVCPQQAYGRRLK